MTEQAVPPASTEDESAGGGPTGRTDAAPADDATRVEGTAPVADDAPAEEAPRADDATPAAGGPTPTSGDPQPAADSEPTAAEPADDSEPIAAEPADEAGPGGRGGHPLLRVLVTLGAVAVLVGVLVVVGLRYDVAGRLLNPDRTADARVGDCLAPLPDVAQGGQRRTAEAREVACSSPDAAYNVVGRVDGQRREQVGDGSQCEPFVAVGATYYIYSSIPPGGTGYLLCLVPRG
ncbi:hypothetical protein [Micromonospora sp. NPDC023956]|uniref:LppU/SCO3897 family protein n=1 Tax=Micromonospora sp. NPDC023956 TaxID=3155722 RepID=UPI0033E4DFD9